MVDAYSLSLTLSALLIAGGLYWRIWERVWAQAMLTFLVAGALLYPDNEAAGRMAFTCVALLGFAACTLTERRSVKPQLGR